MSKEIVKPIPESPYLSPTTRQEKHAGRHRRVVNGPSRRGSDGRAGGGGRKGCCALNVQDVRPTGNLSEGERRPASQSSPVRQSEVRVPQDRTSDGRRTARSSEQWKEQLARSCTWTCGPSWGL